MYKLKEMILMLCLILSGALCYAHGEARMEKEQGEGIPIELNHSGLQVQRFLRYHGNEISYSNIHESSPLGRSR